ncbi:hypothetical protein [Mumia sp. ZJ430]|uniref:hypothetical protein n=1 Tax=Mumia sp. ZJ430 TaxID=2708083 RepID=UPI001AB04E2B|nr:hypothetical protein [Mumia sp. ZJ430]
MDDGGHLPEDALSSLLQRFPDGWGQWIDCDRGWFPLLAALDADLAAVCPEYELRQVKQKYGSLRYYAEPCEDHRAVDDEFRALIASAEKRSSRTCESCGAPGRRSASDHWYRTLCAACGETAAEPTPTV